jgi:hypothetical protein
MCVLSDSVTTVLLDQNERPRFPRSNASADLDLLRLSTRVRGLPATGGDSVRRQPAAHAADVPGGSVSQGTWAVVMSRQQVGQATCVKQGRLITRRAAAALYCHRECPSAPYRRHVLSVQVEARRAVQQGSRITSALAPTRPANDSDGRAPPARPLMIYSVICVEVICKA